MLNLLKKTANEKTAIQITPNQKATTTVANVSSKVKTAAFGVATGAGIAGTMMMQNERSIRNRKAREAYHKRVEQVCTVAVGAAVVGATAAVVQGIFDPVIDVSMLEIEPETYCELHNKAGEFENAGSEETDEQNAEQPAEPVVAEIVPEKETAAHASASEAEKTIVEATATEVQTEVPVDPTPVAPAAEQPAEKVEAGQPAPADKTPTAPAEQNHVDPNAEKPADSAAAAHANQGNNAQDAKSQTGEQKPKDSGQGASNNNPKNGNNHAKAAK